VTKEPRPGLEPGLANAQYLGDVDVVELVVPVVFDPLDDLELDGLAVVDGLVVIVPAVVPVFEPVALALGAVDSSPDAEG
jgi:hypothetical protein